MTGLEGTVRSPAGEARETGLVARLFAVSEYVSRAYLGAVDSGAGNVDAVLQSSVILARGLRGLRQAWAGIVSIAVEDGAASTRALASAPSVRDALSLQTRLAALHSSRTCAQTALLTTMAAQVLEDAAFPVVNRVYHVLDPRTPALP